MRHPHVRVYTNDHADANDLVHDEPCQDLAEARRRMRELVKAYTDQIGAQEAMGERVEVEGTDAVTLWPQDQTRPPMHLSIHSCEQWHAAEG